MPKKFPIVFLTLVFFSFNNSIAQNDSRAFFYNLTYLPDSLNPAKTAKESFVLLIDDSVTSFSSTNYLKLRESITGLEKKVSTGEISSLGGNSLPKTGFKFSIYKLQSNAKTIQIMDMITHNYGVEYPTLLWQMSAEMQFINGIHCKKALLDFAGRAYEAWFSEDIPIAEGPYIFKGLPGLIISISDTARHYKWELSHISDTSGIQAIKYSNKGVTWIKRSEMIKLNTYEGRHSRLVEAGVFESEWVGISKEELIKRAEQNLRRNNNQIELKE